MKSAYRMESRIIRYVRKKKKIEKKELKRLFVAVDISLN